MRGVATRESVSRNRQPAIEEIFVTPTTRALALIFFLEKLVVLLLKSVVESQGHRFSHERC